MADRINFEDRVDQTAPAGTTNEVSATIMNEIKSAVNSHADDIEAIMPSFKGTIAAGTYDFTVTPAPTTGNAFIDGGGAVEAGANFIAAGDGSFTLLPVGGGASVEVAFTEGDKITVTQDATSFSVAVLNVNENVGLAPTPDISDPTITEKGIYSPSELHAEFGQSFGDAQVAIINPVAEDDREHISVSNTSSTGLGISNYRFHLSDDPAVVGTLAGASIVLERDVPKAVSYTHLTLPTKRIV